MSSDLCGKAAGSHLGICNHNSYNHPDHDPDVYDEDDSDDDDDDDDGDDDDDDDYTEDGDDDQQ